MKYFRSRSPSSRSENYLCVTQRQDIIIFFGNKLSFLKLRRSTDRFSRIKSDKEDFTVTNYTYWFVTNFFFFFNLSTIHCNKM